jgi:hypothetical protein
MTKSPDEKNLVHGENVLLPFPLDCGLDRRLAQLAS